jgi:hypothetical protein
MFLVDIFTDYSNVKRRSKLPGTHFNGTAELAIKIKIKIGHSLLISPAPSIWPANIVSNTSLNKIMNYEITHILLKAECLIADPRVSSKKAYYINV